MGPAVQGVVEAVHTHDVVLVGEHHGDVAEIDFLVDVLEAMDRPIVLAMELVPMGADAKPTSATWPAIVGQRYWPAPLYFNEYVRIVDALEAARARGVDIRLAGLAPPCRLPPSPTDADRSVVLDCFRDRDDAMAGALRELRARHPDRPILVSAGWRHVSAVRLPNAPKPMGALLPAHWSVQRVLLAGTEARETGPVATCQGAPLFLADLGDKAVLHHTHPLKWTLAECVDTPSDRPLSEAFDRLVGLPTAPPPTPWTADAFARIDPTDRAAWDRTHRSLMGKSGSVVGPDALAKLAAADAAELAAQQKARVTTCPK